jgi:N utilization substance protein B
VSQHAHPRKEDNSQPFDRFHQEPIDPPVIERDEIFENDPKRDKKLPRRRLARERIMQMLYAHELGGRDLDVLFTELVEEDLKLADQQGSEEASSALEFARELARLFVLHRDKINEILSTKLERWDFSRVALIDRLLIQLGITELLYFPEIPPKATINELIEIAKDYSTDESGKFINGLLHAVMTHLTETGEFHKSGRGLIDRTISERS